MRDLLHNTAVVNIHIRLLILPGCGNERERNCWEYREMLIVNYAFSWSSECIMWAAFKKGKYNDKKCQNVFAAPTQKNRFVHRG